MYVKKKFKVEVLKRVPRPSCIRLLLCSQELQIVFVQNDIVVDDIIHAVQDEIFNDKIKAAALCQHQSGLSQKRSCLPASRRPIPGRRYG